MTDAAAVVARLRDLDARSGGRRVAWTQPWRQEREGLIEWLAAHVPTARIERDPAGNIWARVPGESPETVIVGSHLDCVPAGGWLDGCLGVVAAAEIVRSIAAEGRPRRTLALVDWADEEGARFGHSLLGSSAAAGLLDPAAAGALLDAEGVRLPDALAADGVDIDRMLDARSQLDGAVAYLELHIEQGPVLEAADRAACAVDGCLGVRRSEYVFAGRAVHAGATPMAMRQDPLLAAARFVADVREAAVAAEGLATVGALRTEPGTPTAVAERARAVLDLRHRDRAALEALDADVSAIADRAADAAGCRVERALVWSIDPIRFDASLVDRARALTDGGAPLTSGPLHDAAAVARAGVPTVMVFVRTRGGVSHTREEDAAEADLVAGIAALDALTRELAQ